MNEIRVGRNQSIIDFFNYKRNCTGKNHKEIILLVDSQVRYLVVTLIVRFK